MATEKHNVYRDSFAYAGSTPWHKIGNALPGNVTWEVMEREAKFYNAEKRNLYAPGDVTPIPDKAAVYRMDTREYLATVGADYEIIQANELASTIVQAAGEFKAIWHVAGLMGDRGERFFILGELPQVIRVRGDNSEIRPYVLGFSSHDGSTAARVANVATRVVCQNTLGAALRETGNAKHTIRHTKNAKQRLADASASLRQVLIGVEKFGQLANVMATRRFADTDFEKVIGAMIPIPNDGDEHPGLNKKREEVRGMLHAFTGITPQIAGTAWGALQAATEWADWGRDIRVREGVNADAARLQSNAVGDSADLKARALAEILKISQIPVAA
jgi:phage/plasmid-like protein (TIGR03299 family)